MKLLVLLSTVDINKKGNLKGTSLFLNKLRLRTKNTAIPIKTCQGIQKAV